MRVALGWLGEWIDLPSSQEELEERLTFAGIEIEGVERLGPDLSAVRVGHVVERRGHPDADRLSVCRVDVGDGEPLEIVCGAPNVAAGQKVAVAPVGTVLPDGTRLRRTKIRGVVSNGMICSERELGLGDEHAGILVLDPTAEIGVPLHAVLPVGETVLDVSITPNRGDWVSMLGIAREVRAQFGGTLRVPPIDPPEGDRNAAEDIRIEIEDAAGCHSYVARVVHGVRVGPSPDWLCRKLEAGGLRPINVVVDVTNLVLLEFGQPLHAFDLSSLRGGVVRVRAARGGEKIVTLDGEKRELLEDDLVIADAERAIAVAGVMGGAETEVREGTTSILIESAHFHPSRVRRTARRLGLQTDSSYRFERGVDREGVRRAADRAARLLAELAGGIVSVGTVEARGDPPATTETVELDPERANRLLGTGIAPEEMADLLARIEVTATSTAQGRLQARIPSYRNDLHRPEDLVEEVARIYGYARIEATLPQAPLAKIQRPPTQVLEEQTRDVLKHSGLIEAMTFVAISADSLARLGLGAEDPRRRTVRILNPILEGESELRTSLLPSLLNAARRNLTRQVERVRLFEVSRVFLAKEREALPEERSSVAVVLAGEEEPGLWSGSARTPLFFQLKGVAEALLRELGYVASFPAEADSAYLHPGAACGISVEGQPVGRTGELHPEVVARFEIGVPCAILELDLSRLVELPRREVRYAEVSRQPQVRRDLAVLVDRGIAAGEVLDAIRGAGGRTLVSVEIFDRYQGKGIPEGKVSLAFRLIFQRPDRTLTDDEVSRMTDRVVQTLSQRFGGVLR